MVLVPYLEAVASANDLAQWEKDELARLYHLLVCDSWLANPNPALGYHVSRRRAKILKGKSTKTIVSLVMAA